jgi:hypothetical protein
MSTHKVYASVKRPRICVGASSLMKSGNVPCMAPTPDPESNLAPSQPPGVVTKDSAKIDYLVSELDLDKSRHCLTAVRRTQVVHKATRRPNLSLTKEIATWDRH